MPTILLVEDDEVDVIVFRRGVRKSGRDLTVEVAADGREALRWLDQGGVPDLVVLDLNLPRLSGLELLEELRRRPELADLRTCVYTTSWTSEEIARARELGVAAHLVKGRDPVSAVLDLV